MSVASWRCGFQRCSLAIVAAGIWLCGIGLSVAAFGDHPVLVTYFGGAVMILFIPWATFTGLRFHCQVRDTQPK
jgi:hypothetical protein